MIRIPRLAAFAVVLLALTACATPTGPGATGGGGQPGGGAPVGQPWDYDDVDLEAAVMTSEFAGLPLSGFTCDITGFIGVENFHSAPPYASVTLGPGGGYIEHHDGAGLNLAKTEVEPPTSWVDTLAVDAPDGTYHLSTEGSNDAWSASAVLTFTRIPVPEGTYGCWAGAIWFDQMFNAGTDAAQIIREFETQGVVNVADECADSGIDWAPPNMSCEDFQVAIDSFG